MKLDKRIIPFLIATWTFGGFPGGGLSPGCCFLLLRSPSSELLLLQNGCLTPLSCIELSAMYLESGSPNDLLLEDGTGFLALEFS